MIAQRYELRLQGTLTPALAAAFLPLQTTTEHGGAVTVVHGTVNDQAELSGLLQTIDALGLVLLEVRPESVR